LGGGLAGAVLTVAPRRAPGKVIGGLAGPAIVLGVVAWLFVGGREIRWLAPAAPLTASVVAAFVAMAYSYLTELRHRQFILKALAQSVSQDVADAIARDPKKLELGGERREMTVMFTDLANFTTLSERIDVERLADTLHF
jgi:adenylate cyclase